MSVQHNASEGLQRDTKPSRDSVGRSGRRGRREPDAPSTDTGSGGSLTRVTANFTPRAMAALDDVAASTGDSKTDILNRSVMVYQVFLELVERGGGTLRVRFADGTEENLRFVG